MDGVLLRVEVKSCINRAELRTAVSAAAEIYSMRFTGASAPSSWRPISTIFAFDSDLKGDPSEELQRLLDVCLECSVHRAGPCSSLPGPIGALCVAGRGCWTFGKLPSHPASEWSEAILSEPHDEILHFIGSASNTCFVQHTLRSGGTSPAVGGIGNFILANGGYQRSRVQNPRP